MKKGLLLALSVLAAALVIPAAFAGNGPAPKVNGDVTFTNMGLTQHWVFNAQDLGSGAAKGSVLDEYNGGTTVSKVIQVKVVNAETAEFTTEVTSSTNNPWALVGDQFHYTVHDGGEGSNGTGDYMLYRGVTRGGVYYPSTGQYDITSGNIQVHLNG
jgi:hypothetical protein